MSGGMAGIERLQYCPGYRETTDSEIETSLRCFNCNNSMAHKSRLGTVILYCKKIKRGNKRVGADCICEGFQSKRRPVSKRRTIQDSTGRSSHRQ